MEEKSSSNYLIAVAAFVIVATFGGTRFAFGVFFKPLINELSWSRAVTSGAYSLSYITHGLVGLLIGRIIGRIGPRTIMTVEALCMGVGYVLMARTSQVWQLYLFYSVLIGIGNCVHVPILSTVSQQYSTRRGLMTGIVMAGVGVGQLIVPPLAAWMISTYDWRVAYVVIGIAALVLMIVPAQFLKYPENTPAAASAGERKHTGSVLGLDEPTVRDAVRTKQYWFIIAIHFCLAYCTMSVMVHIVPFATDLGMAPATAASVLSVIGAALIAGRVILGSAADKIGEERVFLVCFVLLVIASAGLLVIRQVWSFYAVALLFGLALSSSSVLGSTLIARIYGLKRHATIVGMATFSFTIGACISPYLFGYIHDLNNSYHEAFLTGVAVAALGLISTIMLVIHKAGDYGGWAAGA